ncbi:MAG: DsbA family protein [Oligoflexia bacterium]|nr:DsbA family protein [Oligoflexia bacterium]
MLLGKNKKNKKKLIILKNSALLVQIFLIVMSIVFVSCNSEVKSRPNFIFKPAPKQGVAVKILGREINYEEFYSGIEGDIFEAEQKLYEIKVDRLRALLLKELMNKDSRKVGLTNDEFLMKFISKNKTPTDKDVDKFIEEKKIPKENVNSDVKLRIKRFLEVEFKKMAVEEWLSESTKKNPVEVYFEKPKRAVFNVEVGNSPSYGSADAKVTIIIFADYQCPFSIKGFQLLEKLIDKYGKKKVRLVFKHYPLPYHQQAYLMASASMCVYHNEAEDFWKFSRLLFEDQLNPTADAIKEKAKKVGISSKDMLAGFERCMIDKKYAKEIDADIEFGRKIGIKATPTIFVNGKIVSGLVTQEILEDLIEEQLEKNN